MEDRWLSVDEIAEYRFDLLSFIKEKLKSSKIAGREEKQIRIVIEE